MTVGKISAAHRSNTNQLPQQVDALPILFHAGWLRTLMLHYRVPTATLQPYIPFTLDTFDDHAYITLVAFTLNDMHPVGCAKMLNPVVKPFATHPFLNLRTYVKQGNKRGIYFLAEWVPHRLLVPIAPVTFGLPFRHGQLQYNHNETPGKLTGSVVDSASRTALTYQGGYDTKQPFTPANDPLTDFLMERYYAFTHAFGISRYFQVHHPPWPQVSADVEVDDAAILYRTGRWPREAVYIGANYSPGFDTVRMSWPRLIANR